MKQKCLVNAKEDEKGIAGQARNDRSFRMKTIYLFLGLLCSTQFLFAQDKFKFGEVPASLLEMTSYEKDTTASAVVLYEYCDTYYDIKKGDFEIVSDYIVRIKILKQEGVEYANGSVPFYRGKTRDLSEEVTGLTGFTYNLENGKVVKEKLSKDYIFIEDVTENEKRLKFALPATKIGSVIEYKYKFNSPYFYNPKDIQFQRSIPVQYSYFKIKIPEYFTFNSGRKGYDHIEVKIKPAYGNFMYNGQQYPYNAKEISAEVNDLPALKDEDFVWNYNDFKSGITFELQKVEFVGIFNDYTQTWNSIVKILNEHENFGKKFNNNELFKNELPLALASKYNVTDSIRAILDLVRSKVKWNDNNALFVDNPQKALIEGVGTSGEINALLITALRNAGFTAYPVAMSLRSRGRLPITYPSIDNLNYFVVSVITDDKTFFLDGTENYTDINVISPDCLVDKAFCVLPNGFEWIDLTNIGNNSNRTILNLYFNEEGVLSGNKTEIYIGENAYCFKNNYNKAKDENEYVKTQEFKNEIQITDYQITDKKENSYNYTELYKFEKPDLQLGENTVISLNPLLFKAMKANVFKAETRKLPIEFSFPYEERINVTLTIPKGYALDETQELKDMTKVLKLLTIPEDSALDETSKPEKIGFDDMIEFNYVIQQKENQIHIAVRFKLNTCIIPAQQYEQLRDFWSKVYDKNNEFISLKKQ